MKQTLLFGLLAIAAAQDVRHGKVSNRLIAAGLIAGIVFQLMEYRIWGVYYYLRNISVPVILLYLLFQMHVLGAGDIKLFSMIASLLTIWELFRCMAFSFLTAGAAGVFYLAADKHRRGKMVYAAKYLLGILRTGKIVPYQPLYEAEAFAFSVPVLLGTILALYYPG